MKQKMPKKTSIGILMSCVLTGMSGLPAAAEVSLDTTMAGQLAFAQCEEYIHIREAADIESEVVAKIYNHGAVTIEGQEGEWYRIHSGNAVGYVKAEYFAVGEAAEQIAEEAAYRVAEVYPEELNIRTAPNLESDVLGFASQNEELEVVAWDGDWMKVALGNDVYGYINAYYVGYHVYYPLAETLEEEQARLLAEQAAAEYGGDSVYEETESTYEEPISEETEAPYVPEYEETEAPYIPEYEETEAPYIPEYEETETPYIPEYEETEAPYIPEYEETEAPYIPEYEETEAPYTPEYEETEAPYIPEYEETEAPYVPEYEETEAPYIPEYEETEAPYVPEYEETEAPVSGTGQQIADYAVQFVGNPYVWGGTSLTNGADCSGFAMSVFANFGIGLSRTAQSQSYGGIQIDLGSLLPGDLLFYNSTGSIDHVAIYIGGGQIVHAANERKGIIISDAYYQTPVCARRYW